MFTHKKFLVLFVLVVGVSIAFNVFGASIPAPTLSFSASPTSISYKGSSTLTWSTTNVNFGCTASDGWSGAKTTSGTSIVIPNTTSTTYSMTCYGNGGSIKNQRQLIFLLVVILLIVAVIVGVGL